MGLQAQKVRPQKKSDTGQAHKRRWPAYWTSLRWKNGMLSLDELSHTLRNGLISNSPPIYSLAGAVMSATDLIAAVESNEFDINDTATVDFVP